MNKELKSYYLALIFITLTIITILISPNISYANAIEITVDEYENTTFTVVESESNDIEGLLWWYPIQIYDFERYQFLTLDDLEVSQLELDLLASIVFAEANI